MNARLQRLVVEAEDIFKAPSHDDLAARQGWKRNADGSYDVDGTIRLSKDWVKDGKLVVRFNNVVGEFICSGIKLTSLEGVPRTVGGAFSCSINRITSLEGAPQTVGGDFYCYGNNKPFTIDDVKAVTKVEGKIYV